MCLCNRVYVRGQFQSVWQLLLCHLITCFCSRMIPYFSLHATNLRLSDVTFRKCFSVIILEFTTHRSSVFDHHSPVSLKWLSDFKKKQFTLFCSFSWSECCILTIGTSSLRVFVQHGGITCLFSSKAFLRTTSQNMTVAEIGEKQAIVLFLDTLLFSESTKARTLLGALVTSAHVGAQRWHISEGGSFSMQ